MSAPRGLNFTAFEMRLRSLVETGRVGLDLGRVRVHRQREVEVALRGIGRMLGDSPLQEIVDSDIIDDQLDASRLRPRKIEDVVDQREELAA